MDPTAFNIDAWVRKRNELNREIDDLYRCKNRVYNYGLGVFDGFAGTGAKCISFVDVGIDCTAIKAAAEAVIEDAIKKKREQLKQHESRITIN